jgi:hypothetical protein
MELLSVNYSGCSLTGKDFEDFVEDVRSTISDKIVYSALYASLRGLAGVELDKPRISELSWRIAGNLPAILAGKPVIVWNNQLQAEWCPVQVTDAVPGIVQVDQVSYAAVRLVCFVMAGSPAGHLFEKVWPVRHIKALRKVFGFAKYDKQKYTGEVPKRPEFPFRDIRQLVNLRFFGQFEPSEQAMLLLAGVDTCSSMKAWNKSTMLLRARKGFECPLGYSVKEVPCYRCELGYDKCQAACRPTTLEKGNCEKCGLTNVWIDARVTTTCVDCSSHQLL